MSWFKRLFGRSDPPRRGPIIIDLTQHDDWHPGDLGKCVVVGGNGFAWISYHNGEVHNRGPVKGEIVRVTRVHSSEFGITLVLRGYSPDTAYHASAFRKLDEKGKGELVERIKKLHVPARRKKELTDA